MESVKFIMDTQKMLETKMNVFIDIEFSKNA